MPYTQQFACDIPTLVRQSTKFLDPQMGEKERDAIEIYAKIKNLAAIGGADYSASLNSLLQAARSYQLLQPEHRKAISTLITIFNAVDDGATIAGFTDVDTININTLKAQTKCYECLDTETRKNLLEFLKCAINTSVAPD